MALDLKRYFLFNKKKWTKGAMIQGEEAQTERELAVKKKDEDKEPGRRLKSNRHKKKAKKWTGKQKKLSSPLRSYGKVARTQSE